MRKLLIFYQARQIVAEHQEMTFGYSDEAQRIAVDNYYRPSNEEILKEYANVWGEVLNSYEIDRSRK